MINDAPDPQNASSGDFVSRTSDVSADDLDAWHSEFERLTGAGQYFFSTNRYIFRASKPAGTLT